MMAPGEPADGGAVAARTQRWLAQLNDRMGGATRQLFRSQLVLRAASEREIREQLRDLCMFAASVCGPSPRKTHCSAVRAAFRDPRAQWLSRSAIESGACGFFCHLLLRETAQNPESAPLVLQLLLDPVLTPCCERDSNAQTQNACEWCLKKPKYYAMACSTLWETLLPFLARAARQHRAVFVRVLDEYLESRGGAFKARRVNCRFAQVAGFWRLLEAIGERKAGDVTERTTELAPRLLSFMMQWSLLCSEREDDSVFDDLLMEKFYQDMQEFMFKCVNATTITRSAFQRLLELFTAPDRKTTQVEKLRFAAFIAVGCLLVKGLASDIRSIILDYKSEWSRDSNGDAFQVVVGIVSHLDSITTGTVFTVLDTLISRYVDSNSTDKLRRELLMHIVYIIVCRQNDIAECTNDPQLVHFQERFLSDIEVEDMQLMPLHWMEVVWRVCFNMTALDIDAFAEEARTFRLSSAQDPDGSRPVAWEEVIKWFPLRQLNRFPAVLKLLGTSFGDSLKLVEPTPVQRTDSLIEAVLASKTGNKRRRLKRDVVVLSDELEASRQNALLLPEVMECICSYMSAKRLCRLSLVCRAFAQVSRSDRLWQPLYMKLVRPLKIRCLHGSSYQHDWKMMFQAKYIAIRKLKSRQRAAARKAERDHDMHFVWHEDEHELRMSVTLASAQLCRECGCNQLFSSNDTAKSHRMMHQKYRCPWPECSESLSSASALKTHIKAEHPPVTEVKKPKNPVEKKSKDASESQVVAGETESKVPAKKEFRCIVEGCTRVYKSEKWLQNHMKREHEKEAAEGQPIAVV